MLIFLLVNGNKNFKRTAQTPMKYLSFIFLFIVACVPLTPTAGDGNSTPSKKLLLNDHAYEPDIKTVQLNPTSNGRVEETRSPVLSLHSREKLVLSFDELHHDVDDYRVRIMHCNADWNRSRLNDIEFLATFNEYIITDFEQSFNTRTPYVHYRYTLPRVKKSGNYIVAVFRGDNQDDLILTQRFMIFESVVGVIPNIGLSSSISQRNHNQQIEFDIKYDNLEVQNPLDEIAVIIRQNQRWDNAISGLKPTFIREFQKKLEYHFFNLESNFMGGNEFRFFDLRSTNFAGININNIDQSEKEITANMMIDQSKKEEAYTYTRDLNGQYFIGKIESSSPEVDGDYIHLNFFLKSPEIKNAKIYVDGAFTEWQLSRENQMIYSEKFGGYLAQLLLKQAWYNYIYHVESEELNNPYYLEGSHFQTENFYEIFVYHRPIGTRGDALVGYLQLNSNSLR